jgi:hypothetical protein
MIYTATGEKPRDSVHPVYRVKHAKRLPGLTARGPGQKPERKETDYIIAGPN